MTLLKNKLARSVTSSLSTSAKTLGIAAALMLNTQNASALGLGALKVESNLDQPLSGSIELRVAEGDDVNTVTAVIASREDFESLGIDYPSYLKDFSILVDTLGAERSLRVTSNNVIIKEPFIHFLVRVEWSGGSFLREYTALIDPPIYASEAPSSVAIPKEVGVDQAYQSDAVQTAYQEPELEVDDIVSDEIVDDTISSVETSNDEVSEESPSLEYVDDTPTDASYGPVESGESLSQIAQDLQTQFPDLSIYQIMKVLFDENESSFINGNINGLIKGSILKIGDLNAIRSVDVDVARSFYTQQISDWDPQVLQAGNSSDSLNVGQESYNFDDTSSDSSSLSDSDADNSDNFQVGASLESDDFVSSSQNSSSDGEVLALRQEVVSLESSLASSALENQELSERIAILEGRLEDLNRLAELNIESGELANVEGALAKQNELEDELLTTSEDSQSSIDDFFSDTSDDLVETGDDLVSTADNAIDSLVEDGSSSVDDFLNNDDSTLDASELLESADDAIDSVVEETQEVVADVKTEVEEVVAAPVKVNTPKPKSLIDKAKSLIFDGGLWKILAGIGALLVAGLGVLFIRRRRADEEFEISMLSIESNSHSVGQSASSSASVSMSHTASMAVDESNADKETSFLTVYSDSDAVVQADEVDPVAEADVYIAYGRDEQAEEVLLDGIVSHPDRIDIKQKLLSLYHKRQNKEGFERVAEELYSQRAALTGDVWSDVCKQGKEVAPDNPLFELSGDDLNTAVEATSEMNLDDSVDETLVSEASDSKLDSSEVDDAEVDGDVANAKEVNTDTVDQLEVSLTSEYDGRSEVSELDEVEIDALEFGDDSSEVIVDDAKSAQADVEENDQKAEDVLEFNFDESQVDSNEGDDVERAVSEVAEVSDLEIDDDYDEARTQFELAKVFVDLGDEDGARTILVELVGSADTSDDVRTDSQALLDSIS